ncbi:CBS domain-containing protein [Seonamhaeicola sp. MEBiC1930]|uniref:CBS domain-containing protein n=1 Tax=Seonamhaeicola sp. MEBiC01930 TaxID=2976768 RepID=UPI00325162BD
MRHHVQVSVIMTKNIISLTRSDYLEHAESLFKKHKIRHIPVVEDKAIIGMLSYTDLMRISVAETTDGDDNCIESVVYNMFTIEQVMAKHVVTVNSHASIKHVAGLLAEGEFHALPVVEDNILVGIVTTTDLLNYFIKQI